jgi:ABC-type phosphate/phosphonate transport system permease subunit
VGLGIIIVFLFIGVAQIIAGVTGIHGGYLAPYNPNAVNYSIAKQAPSLAHPFGTDYIGRDVFSRTLVASRISLLVGVIAVSIALALGLALGPLSGYYGGAIDSVIMRVADVFFAFPYILFVLLLVVVLGPGFRNVFIAIGLLSWASYARIVRGTVLSVKTHGVHRGRQGGRRQRPAHHLRPRAAQQHGAGLRGHRHGHRRRDRHRGGAELPGHRRAAAHASWGNMISDYLNYLQAGSGGWSCSPAWPW